VCEAGKDVDGHYIVSVPVVVFGKRLHLGGIGVPLVVDERGDHFASPEYSVDLSVQTERFLCFQTFCDLGFSQHVFSFLVDGLVQFVHATERIRMLRYTYKRGYVIGGCKMDKTYVLLLFVVLSKAILEKAREYLKDKYLVEPRWKYEMIETFLDEKKRIQ
jgi:hypothetical protein